MCRALVTKLAHKDTDRYMLRYVHTCAYEYIHPRACMFMFQYNCIHTLAHAY